MCTPEGPYSTPHLSGPSSSDTAAVLRDRSQRVRNASQPWGLLPKFARVRLAQATCIGRYVRIRNQYSAFFPARIANIGSIPLQEEPLCLSETTRNALARSDRRRSWRSTGRSPRAGRDEPSHERGR